MSEKSHLLIVQMGGRKCGLMCDDIVELLPRVNITTAPDLPEGILGVVVVRGNLVSVIDPRARIGGATEVGEVGYLVVVNTSGGQLAVVVDDVLDVVQVDREAIAYPARHVGGRSAGIARVWGEPLLTLAAEDLPYVARCHGS